MEEKNELEYDQPVINNFKKNNLLFIILFFIFFPLIHYILMLKKIALITSGESMGIIEIAMKYKQRITMAICTSIKGILFKITKKVISQQFFLLINSIVINYFINTELF